MTKEYVLLLHGLGRTHYSMSKIEHTLKKSGYTVKNIGYPSKKYPIERLVSQYIEPIINTCKDNANTIHFVTHSLGSILVRYYLAGLTLNK